MADRIGIYQAIYDEILDAATDGLPAAGKNELNKIQALIHQATTQAPFRLDDGTSLDGIIANGPACKLPG